MIFYITILIILSIIDIKKLIIPNIIVIPSIALGIYLTGYWHYALIWFIIGAILFYNESLCGGDVKLMSMVGSFTGIISFLIIVLAFCFSALYKPVKFKDSPKPFTPFVLLPSLIFYLMITTYK